MPFRNPFYREPKEEPKRKGKLGAKILFFGILALLIYAILSQFI